MTTPNTSRNSAALAATAILVALLMASFGSSSPAQPAASGLSDGAGSDVTFAKRQVQGGTVVIVNETTPGDATQFSFSGPNGDFPLADGGSIVFDQLTPGSYEFSLPFNVDYVTTVSCDDTDSITADGRLVTPARVTALVEAGEVVTCTFTNTRSVSVLLIKAVIGDPDDPTRFPTRIDGPNFAQAPSIKQNGQSGNHGFAPGTFTITESPLDGYTAVSIRCVDLATDEEIVLASGAVATFELVSGQTADCVVTNTTATTGTVRVTKVTTPATDEVFDFSVSPTGEDNEDTFSLRHGETEIITDIPAGEYELIESEANAYSSVIDCSGGTTNANGRSAVFTVTASATVDCIVTNTLKPGTIVIVQDTEPNGPQDFSFSAVSPSPPNTADLTPAFLLDDDDDPTLDNSRTFLNELPGTHTISQEAVNGYTTVVACDDPTADTTIASAVATVELAPGETVRCTYTSTRIATGTPTPEPTAAPSPTPLPAAVTVQSGPIAAAPIADATPVPTVTPPANPARQAAATEPVPSTSLAITGADPAALAEVAMLFVALGLTASAAARHQHRRNQE